MTIEVRIPVFLRSYARGAKAIEGIGDTIANLLIDLDSRYAGLRDRLVTGEETLHQFVSIYINGEDARLLGALDAELHDGDTVAIMPAVAGGAFAFAAAAAPQTADETAHNESCCRRDRGTGHLPSPSAR